MTDEFRDFELEASRHGYEAGRPKPWWGTGKAPYGEAYRVLVAALRVQRAVQLEQEKP